MISYDFLAPIGEHLGNLDVSGFFGFDEGIRRGFTAVRLEITPAGPESAERDKELADIVDAHCRGALPAHEPDSCGAPDRGARLTYLVTQASGSSASRSILAGSWPLARSASVTCSTTLRTFLRTAIQTRDSAEAAPS